MACSLKWIRTPSVFGHLFFKSVSYVWTFVLPHIGFSLPVAEREREAKSFVVCSMNDQRTGLIYCSDITCFAASFLPLPHCFFGFFFSLSFSFLISRFLICFLQAWADAFRSSPDLTGVVQIYEELKRKGIEFPMSDLETLSPIHTPQRVRGASH